MIKRIKTGIHGLDSLIQGGFVKNSVYLLAGETGTGKTTFGCQFIWQGLEKGEPGVYITMEESPEDIRLDAEQFGWDFVKYEKKGLCKIVFHDPSEVNNLGSVLLNQIRNVNAQRLVVDSTSIMNLNIDNPAQIRRKIFGIIRAIKRNNDTTGLLLSEIPEGTKELSKYGVEEFVADGVVVMNYIGMGDVTARSLIIRKMRRTKHGMDVYPLRITSSGISVKKGDI